MKKLIIIYKVREKEGEELWSESTEYVGDVELKEKFKNSVAEDILRDFITKR